MNNLINVCSRALKYSGYDIKLSTNTFENIDETYGLLEYYNLPETDSVLSR